MNNIVLRGVSHPARRASLGGTIPESPNRRSVQLFDKKAVPTLGKFNCHDEDYFDWKESTINALGTAGLNRFLHDPAVISKHPEIAESVLYSLCGAVRDGQAQRCNSIRWWRRQHPSKETNSPSEEQAGCDGAFWLTRCGGVGFEACSSRHSR